MFQSITVDNFAALLNCTPVDRSSDSMMARPKAIHFSWLGPELFRLRGLTDGLLLLQIYGVVVLQSRDLQLSRNTFYLLSPRLCYFIVLNLGSRYLLTVMIH